MADNELTVIVGDGSQKTLRSVDLGGEHQQIVFVAEGPEAVATTAGATFVYTVDDSPAIPLDPPTAGARYARIRVYETSATSNARLLYRTDGTAPTNGGANAFGYLLHGEMLLVRIADFTDFQMIAHQADGGVFTVYAEWLDSA